MNEQLSRAVKALRTDRESGASALLDQALEALRGAAEAGQTVEVAAALCQAQPAMAPLWNAAIAAVAAAQGHPEPMASLQLRRRTAVRSIVRLTSDLLATGSAGRAMRLVTVSASRTVADVVVALHRAGSLETVSCSEGRPVCEGRQLARSLGASGLNVCFYTDAALAVALDGADAVLVGADALLSRSFVNKVGTRALAAAAFHAGVPLYVLASSDKLLMPVLEARISWPDAAASEVWDAPPAGITVRNPYFEPTPYDWAAAVITDAGVLGGDLVADACRATETPTTRRALDELLAAFDATRVEPPS